MDKTVLTCIICTAGSNISVCTVTFIFIDQIHTPSIILTWIGCTLVYIWKNEYIKKIIHRRKLNTTNKKKFVSIFLRYITPEKMYADIAFRILRCLNFQEVLYWYTYQLSTLLEFQFTVLLIIVSKLEPSFSSIFWNYCTYFIAAAHSL